jgi:hypothetical protein
MRSTGTRRKAGALAAALLGLSCGERPEPEGVVNGRIEGAVWLTGPVAGAMVSAYALDLATGVEGELLGQSAATEDDGRFHIELGNHTGPVLLIARGVGARYVEPASGIAATWDSSTELRAVLVSSVTGSDLEFELESGGVATAVLSPWSDWAMAHAEGRVAAGREGRYVDALKTAIHRFRDHVELDFWEVIPVVLSDPAVGAWSEQVQAAVLSSALSALTLRMARESRISASGLSSLQLVAAVREDVGDPEASLDGQGTGALLKVGTCTTICPLGPRTLRGHLAEAAADFLGSPANRSGIVVTDAHALLSRVASRASDLWPAGGDPSFDTQAPSVSVIGLQEADILSGTVMATIRVFDAIEMDAVTLSFTRAGQPVTGFFTQTSTSPDNQTRLITLSIRTTDVADGPLLLHIEATDKAGNPAKPMDLSLFLDNSPVGSVSGTVVLGGRVAGARGGAGG